MSEFADMLKEAFVDAPVDPSPGRQALQASVDKYQRRMRTVRMMAWFAVAFMTAVAVWMAVLLLNAPDDTSARTLVIEGIVFVWAMLAIGMGKMWFAMMQNHFAVMRELKVAQMMVLNGSSRGTATEGGLG